MRRESEKVTAGGWTEESWNPGPDALRMLCYHKVKLIQLQSSNLAWVWEGSEVSISSINYYSIPKSPPSPKIIFDFYTWYHSSGKLLFILQNLTQLSLALYSLPCPSSLFKECFLSIPELVLLPLHISKCCNTEWLVLRVYICLLH